MNRFIALAVTIGLVCAPGAGQTAAPASAPASGAIAPYLEADSLAVVRVDLSRVDLQAVFATFEKMLGPEDSHAAKSLAEAKAAAGKWLGDFLKAGGKDVYLVVNMADLPNPPFYAVVPLGKDADAKAIAGLLILGQSEVPETFTGVATSGPFKAADRIGDALVAGSEDQLQRLKQNKPADRPELVKALAAAGDSVVQAALAPSPDTRKVLVDSLPNLPAELGGGDTAALTGGLSWAAVGINPAPKWSLRVVIQSPDQERAKALGEFVSGIFKAVGELKEPAERLPALPKVLSMLTPKVEGDRLVLALGEKEMDTLLLDLAGPSLRRARLQAKRAMSAANIRGILMGVHMYAAANKDQFPPDFQAVVKMGAISDKMLTNNPARPDMKPGYVYLRPAATMDKVKDPAGLMVIYEAHDRFGEGVNVGFADGHVKFIGDAEEFRRLLEAAKAAGSVPAPAATAPARG